MLVAVISDTHLPRGRRHLPAQCMDRLRAADLIIHAGDIITVAVLDEIEAIGPEVVAVRGNVDEPALQHRLPAERVLEAEGARVGIVHDAGPAKGRSDRMRHRFPGCDAVIFGHSHIPLHERADDGFQIFNPGSATDRRRQPRHTMGSLTLAAGAPPRFDLVTLPA